MVDDAVRFNDEFAKRPEPWLRHGSPAYREPGKSPSGLAYLAYHPVGIAW